MEIIIQVEKILDVFSFTSKKDGQVCNKYSFVGKTTQGQYPKNICFSCMGDELWKKFDIKVGATYQVSFDVSSREWNGRWFTEVNAWRVQIISDGGSAPQTQAYANPYVAAEQSAQQSDSGLPF